MSEVKKIGNVWAEYCSKDWVIVADSEHEMECDRNAELTKEDLKLLLENWPEETDGL